MAVRFRNKPAAPPAPELEMPADPTPTGIAEDCAQALAAWKTTPELQDQKLMLAHRQSGVAYRVVAATMLDDEGQQWQLTLIDGMGIELHPRFTPRENRLYEPIWR